MRARWLLALLPAALLGTALAQNILVHGRTELRDRLITTERYAYGLMAPELVAGPSIAQVCPSPGGRYAILRQVDPDRGPGTKTAYPSRLLVWNRAAHRTSTIRQQAARDCPIHNVTWLAGSDAALVHVTEQLPPTTAHPDGDRVGRLLYVNPAAGALQVLFDVPEGESVSVEASPTRPLAVVHRTSVTSAPAGTPGAPPRVSVRSVLQVVRGNGLISGPIALPDRGGVQIRWSQDGAAPIVDWSVGWRNGKPVEQALFALDVGSGRLTQLDKSPALYDLRQAAERGASTWPLRLRPAPATVAQGGTTQRIRALWLECTEPADKPRALVNPNATWSQLSPAGDTVLYVADGAAWAAPVARVARSAYDEQYRTAAMSDAKHAGLGIMMYVQDYDGKYPLSDQFAGGAIDPYLKDAGVADGFTYLYPAIGMADLTSPATTPIGFVPGPGGRAVVYGDGHVLWEPDKP